MNKKLVSVIMTGAMAATVLAGCGNSAAPAAEAPATEAAPAAATEAAPATADVASEGEHTLSVEAWDANFNIPALKAAEEDYKKNVDPEFSLNIIEASQSSDVEDMITLAGSAGDYSTLPDIVLFQDHYIQRYVSDYPDAWHDLSAADVNWDDFGAEKLSYSTINGVHYGFPVDNGTAIFAYRTDILEQAGYTIDDVTGCSWDKWIEIGSDVYAKTGKYLMSMDGNGNDLPYMMLQAEGKSQFKDGKAQLTDETVKKVVDVIVRAQQANALYLANDWSDYTDQTIVGDMVAGVMNGNWIIPTMKQVSENSGKWQITTLPTLDGGKEGYASNGGSSLYITGNCQNTALAEDFLAKTFGAGSAETYDAALKNGGVITCSMTAGASDVYNEGVDFFNDQPIYTTIVEYGTHVPVVEQSDFHYTAREQVAAAIQNILNGTDLDTAMQDAQDQLAFAMGQ